VGQGLQRSRKGDSTAHGVDRPCSHVGQGPVTSLEFVAWDNGLQT
jgi:hypothetical protein